MIDAFLYVHHTSIKSEKQCQTTTVFRVLILYLVLVPSPYMDYLIYPWQLGATVIPFYRTQHQGSERWSHLSKLTELVCW